MSSNCLTFATSKNRSRSITKALGTRYRNQTAEQPHKVRKSIQKRKKSRKGIIAAAVGDTMATSQTPQVSQLAVQYEDVKAWITAQEKVERETSKPAPLTEAQRKALESLYHSIKSPSPEPELDDNDWVSVLKNYRDAHPNGQLDYIEEPVAGTDRWAMRCRISESEFPFPSIPPGEKLVTFARKKDAKKYAAKCTVEWLIEKKLMPEDGSVTFPKPAFMSPLPPDTPTSEAYPDLDVDNSMPATQRVPAVCSVLKLQPPSYVLQQDPNIPSRFSGWAEFAGGMGVSTQLGHVENVSPKKAAKEKIASLVLQHLLNIEAERAEQADELLQSL